MYSISERRKDPCPTKIVFVRQAFLIECKRRTANARRYSDKVIKRITFAPLSTMRSRASFAHFSFARKALAIVHRLSLGPMLDHSP